MKLALTAGGLDFLRKCLQGGPSPEFCKIVFGNGNDAGNNASEMSNPVKEIDIQSITRKENYVTLVGILNNTEIAERFKATELGVYITDPNVSEGTILYAYGHVAEAEAALIPSATDYLIETEEIIFVYVGAVDNVTAILSDSSLFASKNELNKHKTDSENPHNVTAEQLGLSVEDISSKFLSKTQGLNSLLTATDISVYKQGNVISGSMKLTGEFEAGSEEFDITNLYKPKHKTNMQVLAKNNADTTIGGNEKIQVFIEDGFLFVEPLSYGYNYILISFSYICE